MAGRGSITTTAETGDFLDDDTLQIVFGYLSSKYLLGVVALVCKRWNRLTMFCIKALYSSDFNQLEPKSSIAQKIFQIAFKSSSTLKTLDIFSQCGFRRGQSQQLIPELKLLKKLSLDTIGNVTSPDDIYSIINLLPSSLEYIDLHENHSFIHCGKECNRRSSLLNPYFTDRHLITLSKRCPRLTHIDLASISSFTLDAVHSLISSCPSIITLCMHAHTLGWTDVAYIFKSCPNLQKFSLVSTLLNNESGDNFIDEDYESSSLLNRRRVRGRLLPSPHRRGIGIIPTPSSSLSSSSPFLSQSTASDFHSSSSSSLTLLPISPSSPSFPIPPSLRSLKLFTQVCKSVRWDAEFLAPFLRAIGCNLHALIAHGCFNASWQRISVLCPYLTCLDLTHQDQFTELVEVEELVLVGAFRLLPNLMQLALPSATENVLKTCGKFCKKMKEFRIQTYGSLLPPESNSMGGYREGINDAGVRLLVEGCVDLHTLVLSRCSKISVSAIRAIVFHCPKLQNLQLQGCLSLGDEIAQVLKPALLHRELRALNVEGCNVTQNFLHTLISFSTEKRLKLKTLGFKSKKSLPSPMIADLKNSGICSIVNSKFSYPSSQWNGFQFSDLIPVDFDLVSVHPF